MRMGHPPLVGELEGGVKEGLEGQRERGRVGRVDGCELLDKVEGAVKQTRAVGTAAVLNDNLVSLCNNKFEVAFI